MGECSQQLFWLHLTLVMVIVVIDEIDGRRFGRCELASELIKHKIPRHQLPHWLCIAEHESRMDTAAINRHNYDGSSDHGLFQINDRYWCKPGGANVCKIKCTDLRNDYIGDDVACAKVIYGIHGYSAWVAWTRRCQHRDLNYFMHGCHV